MSEPGGYEDIMRLDEQEPDLVPCPSHKGEVLMFCPQCVREMHTKLTQELEDKCSDSECLWQQDYVGGEYETSCSRSFMFQDDSNLADNDFKFCPFCGGKIIPNEPTDEGDERD